MVHAPHSMPVNVITFTFTFNSFSKSGWGAISLLLRNHAFYRRVAAWDAPTMLSGAFCDWMVAGGSKSKDMWNMMEQFGASATECTPVHQPTCTCSQAVHWWSGQ